MKQLHQTRYRCYYCKHTHEPTKTIIIKSGIETRFICLACYEAQQPQQ